MKKIEKTIDIILILTAYAAIIMLTGTIIPIGQSESPSLKSIEIASNDIVENIRDSNSIEDEKKYDFKMIIDERLFIQKQDLFIVTPAGNTEDSDDKSSKESETGAEEGSSASDIEVQEDLRIDRDSGYPTTEGSGDRAAAEEKTENNQETALIKENIDLKDNSNFKIEVNLDRQMVIVFYKDDILREMVCSGGTPESPTPPGRFVTSEKIEYAWVDRFGVGAYYWVRFFEEYLFHSVPFDENGEMIIEEFEKLGNPASHGCIRLKLEEAEWLYETLPLGVEVLIR